MQGLQLYLQTEMFYQYKLDLNNHINIGLNYLFKKAMKLQVDKKQFSSIVYLKEKHQKVEYLVEKYNYKTRIGCMQNGSLVNLSIPALSTPSFPSY